MAFDEPLDAYLDPKDFGDVVVFRLVPAAASLNHGSGDGPTFKLTAVATGFAGNDISFAIVEPSEFGDDLAIDVDGTEIVVTLATDGDGAPITTGTELAAALAANEDASALVTLSNLANASAVVLVSDPRNLSGGRGGDIECNAIVDRPGVQANAGPRGRIETDLPELWCKTADVLNVRREDTVTYPDAITGTDVTCEVVRKEPDGTGMSVVYLAPDQ